MNKLITYALATIAATLLCNNIMQANDASDENQMPCLNYSTGEVFMTDTPDEYQIQKTAYFDGNDYIIELNINYAILETDPDYPGYVEWWCPGGYTQPSGPKKPRVPAYILLETEDFRDMIPSSSFSIEKFKYTDFPGYKLVPFYAEILDCYGKPDCPGEPIPSEIEPYDGFYPADNELFLEPGNTVWAAVFIAQYDYNNTTVRALNYIKVRIHDVKSNIEEITSSETPISNLYNIQGQKIKNPRKNQLILEQRGNSTKKIITK